MLRFVLRHPKINNDPEYIITEFLPDEKDEKVVNFWAKPTENELFLRYQTNFFHPAFMSRFISRAGRMAKNYDNIWRNGIWITHRNAHALIEAFPQRHEIWIRIKGDPGVLLLFGIHRTFREIFYDPDSVKMDIALADKEFRHYRELKEGKLKGFKKIISQSRQMIDLEKVEFFTEVLDAKTEEEVKRKLSDIVPKPRIKANPEAEENITLMIMQKVNQLLKEEIGQDLEQALTITNTLIANWKLKNDIVATQGRYADLKRFMDLGKMGFEDFSQHSNLIRGALIYLVDRIDKKELNPQGSGGVCAGEGGVNGVDDRPFIY